MNLLAAMAADAAVTTRTTCKLSYRKPSIARLLCKAFDN